MAELLEDFFDAEKSAMETLSDGSVIATQKDANQAFAASFTDSLHSENGFTNWMKLLNGTPTDFEFEGDEDGVFFKKGDNRVDMSDVKTSLLQGDRVGGKTFLDLMGGVTEISPEMKTSFKSVSEAISKSNYVKTFETDTPLKNPVDGTTTADSTESVNSAIKELNTITKQAIAEMREEMADTQSSVRNFIANQSANGFKSGTDWGAHFTQIFIASGAALGIGVAFEEAKQGLINLDNFLKSVQHARNGCWLRTKNMTSNSATSCKIMPLSCSAMTDVNSPQSNPFHTTQDTVSQCAICQGSQTIKECQTSDTTFIVQQKLTFVAGGNNPGTASNSATKPNQRVSFENVTKATNDLNSDFCTGTPGKFCSDACHSKNFPGLKSNQELQRVEMSLWSAASQLCGDCLSLGSDSLWAKLARHGLVLSGLVLSLVLVIWAIKSVVMNDLI
uniref:Uncharacterized protein n=1 Tax=viral metagenome TaxID=1070528 RepID=A0A6C0KE07_9ZZZZ